MKLPLPPDPLLLLLLQIARRADELAPGTSGASGRSVEPWLQAEREICGPGLPAPSLPVSAGIRAA